MQYLKIDQQMKIANNPGDTGTKAAVYTFTATLIQICSSMISNQTGK